jgi:predicted regulator of Ras-like GTPase activity (Roadblock/LC7/MglB family)
MNTEQLTTTERKIERFGQILSQKPGDELTVLALAEASFRRGLKLEALTAYQEVTKEKPVPEAHLAVAEIYSQQSMINEAYTELSRLFEIDSENVEARLLAHSLEERAPLPDEIRAVLSVPTSDEAFEEAHLRLKIQLTIHNRELQERTRNVTLEPGVVIHEYYVEEAKKKLIDVQEQLRRIVELKAHNEELRHAPPPEPVAPQSEDELAAVEVQADEEAPELVADSEVLDAPEPGPVSPQDPVDSTPSHPGDLEATVSPDLMSGSGEAPVPVGAHAEMGVESASDITPPSVEPEDVGMALESQVVPGVAVAQLVDSQPELGLQQPGEQPVEPQAEIGLQYPAAEQPVEPQPEIGLQTLPTEQPMEAQPEIGLQQPPTEPPVDAQPEIGLQRPPTEQPADAQPEIGLQHPPTEQPVDAQPEIGLQHPPTEQPAEQPEIGLQHTPAEHPVGPQHQMELQQPPVEDTPQIELGQQESTVQPEIALQQQAPEEQYIAPDPAENVEPLQAEHEFGFAHEAEQPLPAEVGFEQPATAETGAEQALEIGLVRPPEAQPVGHQSEFDQEDPPIVEQSPLQPEVELNVAHGGEFQSDPGELVPSTPGLELQSIPVAEHPVVPQLEPELPTEYSSNEEPVPVVQLESPVEPELPIQDSEPVPSEPAELQTNMSSAELQVQPQPSASPLEPSIEPPAPDLPEPEPEVESAEAVEFVPQPQDQPMQPDFDIGVESVVSPDLPDEPLTSPQEIQVEEPEPVEAPYEEPISVVEDAPPPEVVPEPQASAGSAADRAAFYESKAEELGKLTGTLARTRGVTSIFLVSRDGTTIDSVVKDDVTEQRVGDLVKDSFEFLLAYAKSPAYWVLECTGGIFVMQTLDEHHVLIAIGQAGANFGALRYTMDKTKAKFGAILGDIPL